MEIQTTILSTEAIKPSSPTPKSLQKHQLSFLDQIAPPSIMPLVYFYPPNTETTNSQKSDHLKNTLSQVLSKFYPLAGRLVGNLYVDCDDSGAPFSEAEANCDLSQVISNPDPRNMKEFLPYNVIHSQDACMAVQATYFCCGGLAVGLLISHKVADALSFVSFANAWSAIARSTDGALDLIPKFDAATYFPPRDISGYKPSAGMMTEEISTRIFTFPAKKLALLREKYAAAAATGDEVPQRRPSRVEVLSAFLWTRFIAATGMKADANKLYTVQHAVNLRTRTDPPLSEYHFGNISRIAIATPAVGEGGVMNGGVDLMNRVREAIKGINGSYVVHLRDGEKHLNLLRQRLARLDKGELVSFSFTSLCRFPLYETDFGWGKPEWVASDVFAYKNLVTFMDSKDGDGIEAWVHLRKEDMDKFKNDLELQQFLSHENTSLIS